MKVLNGMSRRDWLRLAGGAAAAPGSLFGAESNIPAHPSQLEFGGLDFEPPRPEDHRHELPHGAIAYLVEDHQLPLIRLGVTVRTGGYLVPDEHLGLASMTGSQMRAGGTKSMSAREFDEEAAFLATEISSRIGGTSARAGLDCLKQNLEPSLAMFFDMLRNPAFDPERLELARRRSLQRMERRNDRTDGIEGREFRRLMRGDDHFSAKPTTKATIEAVTPELMREFHARYYHPSSLIFAAAGDFDSKDLVARLSDALGEGWPGEKPEVPEVPAPDYRPVPGLAMVDKPDVNQSRVSIGHLGIQRDNPDHIAVMIMNSILGGGGFTSRIMTRVRSDEGLAYSAGSSFRAGTYYPGVFRASFQSKNASCAQATAIVLEEIERIRNDKVSQEELDTAKNYIIGIFPRFFATSSMVVGTFADDEYTGREKGYWSRYRDRVAAVTADDVMRTAQKYLQPDDAAILAVGHVEEMLAGNPDKPQYKFENFTKDGGIRRIPLPDPMTMEYPG